MSNMIGKFFLGLAGKWLANKVLKNESKEAVEIIEKVLVPPIPLDVSMYDKIFNDPLFRKKLEILKEHIPELLYEFAAFNSWFTMPRVEAMLDFVTDKTNKVILPEPKKDLTDLEKVQSATWGDRSNAKIPTRMDGSVKLKVSSINLDSEKAFFDHNADEQWKDYTRLKEAQVEHPKKLAPWILCSILEYEKGKWYAQSFEPISGKNKKNIGRVLRGGPMTTVKYAPKKDQLVGFWIEPAFDIEQGMSEITWKKLV